MRALTDRSRALTASVSLSVVALASARSRPSRSRCASRRRPRADTVSAVMSVEDCVRSRTVASRDSSASALLSRAFGMRSSNEPPEPLPLATDELATIAADRVRHAQDAGRDVLDLARAGGERERGAALLVAGAAAVRPGTRPLRRREGRRPSASAGRRASSRRSRRSRRRRRPRSRSLAMLPPPELPESSSLERFTVDRPTTSSATQAKLTAAISGRRWVFRTAHGDRRGGRGKPAAARVSSSRAHAGSGRGGSSRSSSPSSASSGGRVSGAVIDGPPELRHGAVELGAGVGDADAEHGGELGVVEPGVELERDQLALARRQAGERGADGGALERALGGVVGRRRAGIRRLGGERRGALAPPQLVERGVARDPEQPGARAALAPGRSGAPCGRRARTPGRSRPRPRCGRAAA